MISKKAKELVGMCLDIAPNYRSIDEYIRQNAVASEILTEAAYEIIDIIMYVDSYSSKYLAPLMEIFLSNGMSPNASYDGEVLMHLLRFIHKDYAGADTLSVFFEYGGNPDIQTDDGTTMLAEILEDVSIGAFDDDEKDDGAMHCMLVVAGYGGTLMNGETAKMLDGYDKSVLKNHRLFDCTVVKDKEVYVHAVLKSTGRTAAII